MNSANVTELINEGNSAYGLRSLVDECQKLAKVPRGKGLVNRALNETACKLGSLVPEHLTEEAVVFSLMQVCWNNGYCEDHKPWYVEGVIKSGMEAGMKSPRGPVNGSAANDNTAEWELSLQWGDTIEAKEKEWLWPGVLPNREFTILAGDPGIGKSFISISTCASVTTGGNWPASTEKAPLGNVIYLSTEDDPEDTIKPRLLACGADPSKVGISTTMKRGDTERAFSLKDDIPKLRDAIERAGNVKLVIVDTIGNHMGGADRNKAEDVRAITTQLTAIAREYDLAVLGITHLNKGEGSALKRVTGSTDWTGAARAVWVVDREDDSNRRKMTPAKVSHGGDTTGYAYTLEPEVVEGISTAKIVWEESSFEQTANQMLREKTEGSSKLEDAMEFIQAMCPMPASELLRKAKDAGISKPTLDRAKAKLGARSEWDSKACTYKWVLPSAEPDPVFNYRV